MRRFATANWHTERCCWFIHGSCKGPWVFAYEKLNKVSNSVGGGLYALEGQLARAQQNDNVVWSLLTRFQKRLVTFSCFPLPSTNLESHEPTCIWAEHCPFNGMGFKLVWSRQIASCKHVYHGWCAFVHFSQSTKCIDVLCGEEMHTG